MSLIQVDPYFSYDFELLDMIATNKEKICKGLRIYYDICNLLYWFYIVVCIHLEAIVSNPSIKTGRWVSGNLLNGDLQFFACLCYDTLNSSEELKIV